MALDEDGSEIIVPAPNEPLLYRCNNENHSISYVANGDRIGSIPARIPPGAVLEAMFKHHDFVYDFDVYAKQRNFKVLDFNRERDVAAAVKAASNPDRFKNCDFYFECVVSDIALTYCSMTIRINTDFQFGLYSIVFEYFVEVTLKVGTHFKHQAPSLQAATHLADQLHDTDYKDLRRPSFRWSKPSPVRRVGFGFEPLNQTKLPDALSKMMATKFW